MSGFDAKRYRRERQNLRAAERLDVLEPAPPKAGCNTQLPSGRVCRRRVVVAYTTNLGVRRLCLEHIRGYETHDRIVARILEFSPRPTDRLWKRRRREAKDPRQRPAQPSVMRAEARQPTRAGPSSAA